MKLTYVRTDYEITEHAVYVDAIFVDEDGKEYRVHGSAFMWQLIPHNTNK